MDREQLFLLPPDVRDWLPTDHSARFLSVLVDHLDLSAFVAKNESSWDRGRPAYHPRVMVGIVLYASMCSVASSRRIARLLVTDVGFRVVAANETPDHSTISRFLVRYGDEIEDLFAVVVGMAAEAGLVDPTLVAVDGTKMPGDASKSANTTAEDLRARYRDWLAGVEAADAADDTGDGSGPIAEMGDEDSMQAWIRANLDRFNDLADDDRVNETDPDSAMVPRSGGGWYQGYNAQAAAVAGGIVIGADVTSSPVDSMMLVPMCHNVAVAVRDATGQEAGVVVADAGYWSTDALAMIDADDMLPDPLVATGRKTPKEAPGPPPVVDPAAIEAYEHADAAYQAALDTQTADRVAVIARVVAGELTAREGGQALGLSQQRVQELKTDWINNGGATAMAAPYLYGRRRPSPPRQPTEAEHARHAMNKRLASPAGRSMYRQRQAIIEPVFGDIKTNRRLTRFLRRGINKVQTDWKLMLTGHNLTILHQRG